MESGETVGKTRVRRSIETLQLNVDVLSKLLLLATVIILIAYSSKFILGLPQAKEYLASAFERLFDKQQHEGDLRWQVLLAIGAMQLQLLICAAICANFHSRVEALIANTGSRAWYLATAAVIIALAWPFYTLCESINGAYASVVEDFTKRDGALVHNIALATAKSKFIDPAWRYYFGSVAGSRVAAAVIARTILRGAPGAC